MTSRCPSKAECHCLPCPEGTAVETDELQASDSDTVLLLDKSRPLVLTLFFSVQNSPKQRATLPEQCG